MKKTYIYLFLGLTFISLMTLGCTGGTNTSNTNETQNQGMYQTKTQNLDTMAWKSIIALGKPVKCTFDYTDQRSGQLSHAIMYVKGKDIRVEITSDQMSAVEIIKGDTVYLKSSKGKETIPGCDWIKMEMNKSITGNETATEAVSPEKIEGKTNYHCELSNFGDDKFQVSGGTICDLNEMIKKMQAEQENKSMGG